MWRVLVQIIMVFALVVPSMASGASGRRVDLANGQVDGQVVLGKTVAGVKAALGRPDYRSGKAAHLVLGWGTRPNFSVEVIFRPTAAGERAWSVAFEQHVRDVKLGDLLGRSSLALERALRVVYRNRLVLVRPYRCAAGLCVGEFAARSGALHVTFGTRSGPLGTWLTMWQAPAS